jgi:hypothetical protein
MAEVAFMRKLLTVCAGLVVVLCIVSGYLWRELRTERQLATEQQDQMTQRIYFDLGSARLPTSQTKVEAITTPVASAKVPDPAPISHAGQRAHQDVPESPSVLVTPAAAVRFEEMRRAEVLQKAEQDSTGKVLAWRDRLAVAGQTLTTAQLQALNAAATSENRLHAEESFERAANAIPPRDDEDVSRAREEELSRSHDTNLRILQIVRPQLTEEQGKALRTQFDTGHATRMAAIQVERERAALIREAQALQGSLLPSSR